MMSLGFTVLSGNVLLFTASFLLLVLPVAFGCRLEMIKTQMKTVETGQVFFERDNQRLQQLYKNTTKAVAVELENLENLVDKMHLDQKVIEELTAALKASYDEESKMLAEVSGKKKVIETMKYQFALAVNEITHLQDKKVQGYLDICKVLLERTNSTSIFAARSLGKYLMEVQNNAITMGQEILLERMTTAFGFTMTMREHLTVQIESNYNVLQRIKEDITVVKENIHNVQDLALKENKKLENIKAYIKNLKIDSLKLDGETTVLVNELQAIKQTMLNYKGDKECYSKMLQIDDLKPVLP